MGRKKRVLNVRKKTLQLSDDKKSEGAQLSGKGVYTQSVTLAAGDSNLPSNETAEQGNGLGDRQVDEDANTRIEDFMKEIHSLGSREEAEDPAMDTQNHSEEEGDGEKGGGGRGGGGGGGEQQKEGEGTEQMDTAQPTFWQQVIDPNTNHPYYWNPATNEVCWTLPEGGVISQPLGYVGQGGGEGAEGEEPPDYFSYYDQPYSGAGGGKEGGGKGGGGEGDGGGGGSVDSSTRAKEGGGVSGSSEGKSETRSVEKSRNEAVKESEGTARSVEEEEGEVMGPLPAGKAGGGGKVGEGEEEEEGVMVLQPGQSSAGVKRRAEDTVRNEEEEEKGVGPQLEPTTTLQGSDHVDGSSVSPPRKMARSTRTAGRGSEERSARKSHGAATPSTATRQAEQALRFQVSSMADELSRKLQFLHVSSEGISDMQLLQVELKTRLSDWKEGGLSSKFLLAKLKQASQDLLCYEEQAAPQGWKYVWDSTTCRYQFHNLSTGDTSWEYPSATPLSSDSEQQSSESSGEDEEEEKEGNQEETRKVDSPPVEQTTAERPVSPERPPSPPQSRPPQPSKPAKVVMHITKPSAPGARLAPPPSRPTPETTAPSPLPAKKKTAKPSPQPAKSTPSQVKGQASGKEGPKAMDTPTAEFLRGSEMVPAPLPRAWKYENDELNRRVKREGSIERREDVSEQELTAEGVRQKLQKRSLLHPRRAPRPRQRESPPEAELPPPPAHLPPSAPGPTPVPSVPVPCTTPVRPQIGGSIGKEDIFPPREKERSPPKFRERETEGKHGTAVVNEEGEVTQERDEEKGRDKERKPSSPDQPSLQRMDEGPRGVAVEERVEEEGGEASAASSLPPMAGEESEAKLRERLILKTKHIRMGGEGGSSVAAADQTDLPPHQQKVIEASTGMLYQELEGERPGGGGQWSRSRGGQGSVRSGFGRIQVSYDRVEPETGESENVAVGGVGGGGGVGGKRVKTEVQGAEPGSIVQGEAMEGSKAASKHKVLEELSSVPVPPEADKDQTDMGDMKVEQSEGDQPLDSSMLSANKSLTPVSDVPFEDDLEAERRERGQEEEEEGRRRERGRPMERMGGERERSGRREEEGEIRSRSPTPIARPKRKVITPSRCYMDEEGGRGRQREMERKGDRYHYDSDRSDYSEHDDRQGRSHRHHSYSRSRSRSRSGDRRRSKGSRHRRGTSDHSDYEYRYSGDERRGRRSKKRRHRYDDYSDHSVSSDEYHSRYHKDEYGSERRHRDRSSDRSRRSRQDDGRSSRSHKHRSRSPSKESRDSSGRKEKGKRKHKDKKEKRHKKEKKEEGEGGPTKPPANVMVGKVGKVSSLRTLGQKKGGEGEGGEGDTLLDRAQAAIAESIEEKQKRERQERNKKEESRQLENKIQQQLQHGRSNHQTQATVMYPTYQQAGQGAYYPTVYPGYQYAYAQGWGGQWGAGSEQYTQAQQYGSVAGAGQQYGTVTGSGEQQYGNVAGVGTETQQYGQAQQPLTSAYGGQEVSTATYSSDGSAQAVTAETSAISQDIEGRKEGGDGGVSGEQLETGETGVIPGQLAEKEEVEKGEMGGEEEKGEERKDREEEGEEEEGKEQEEDMIAECEMEIEDESREESPLKEVADATCDTMGGMEQAGERAGQTTFEHGGSELEETSAPVQQEIENLPKPPSPPPLSAPPAVAETKQPPPQPFVSPPPQTTVQETLSPRSPSAGQDDLAPATSREQPPREESVKSSPEPLPPGIEAETAVKTPPAPPPAPPRKRVKRWDIMEEAGTASVTADTVASTAALASAVSTVPGPSSEGDTKATPPPPGTDTEEPAPPGMESEHLHQPLPADTSETAMEVSSSPSASPPPLGPDAEGQGAGDVSQPSAGEGEEKKGEEKKAEGGGSASSQDDTASTSQPDSSTTAAPSSISTTTATSAPAPSTSSVPTTTYEGQAAYYGQTSQGYNYAAAAAAAAYAQASGTGQQYPYGSYPGYDYATYNAYMQQMAQSGAYGGYTLGADGQYYYQQNPYAAYGGYGAYYSAGTPYSYGTSTAYQTVPQQQSYATQPVSTTTATAISSDATEAAKKEKAKKGEFALSDSKEKQVKSMMDKWTAFKDKE